MTVRSHSGYSWRPSPQRPGRPKGSSNLLPSKPHRRINLPSSALAKTRRSGVFLNRHGFRAHSGPSRAPIAHAQGWPAAPSYLLPCDLFLASASRVQTRHPCGRPGGRGGGRGGTAGSRADLLFPDPAFPGKRPLRYFPGLPGAGV